jgi:hypothetical protein
MSEALRVQRSFVGNDEWAHGFYKGARQGVIDSTVGIVIAAYDFAGEVRHGLSILQSDEVDLTQVVRSFNGPAGQAIVTATANQAKAMGGTVEHAMGWAYLAAQHTVQRDVATMTRNTEELRRLDAERGRVMADAATFLEELQPVIDGMPEEDRGYIVGQVYASAATTVVTTAATGGIGTVPVIAAVAMRTRTMANALLTARVLSKLPENRRDAFRQTVERLRDRSDRLEAPSEPAAMLCAMYESYCTENPSDRGWEAFKKTMLHAREWRDEG